MWQTNALPLSSGASLAALAEPASSSGATSDEGGVFWTLSRVNHACMPNARYEWDAMCAQMRLIALEDVEPGAFPERNGAATSPRGSAATPSHPPPPSPRAHPHPGTELTITYGAELSIDPRVSVDAGRQLPHEERRKRLHEKFGFWCRCAACVHAGFCDGPPPNGEESGRAVTVAAGGEEAQESEEDVELSDEDSECCEDSEDSGSEADSQTRSELSDVEEEEEGDDERD